MSVIRASNLGSRAINRALKPPLFSGNYGKNGATGDPNKIILKVDIKTGKKLVG